MAFSCTVVSTMTRDSSRASTAFIDRAAAIVCASSSSMPASPSRRRQRVSELGSQGSRVWKNTSPVKNCQYGFSSQRTQTSSSDRLYACLRYSSPAISRTGRAGRPPAAGAGGRVLANADSNSAHGIRAASWASG